MFNGNKARLGKRHDPFDAIAACAAAKTMIGACRAGLDVKAFADRQHPG